MPPRAVHPVTTAALWMGGALVSFILMAVAARELSSSLGTFQILFFRSLIGLTVILLILGRRGLRTVASTHLRLHLVRNLSHYAGQFGWFYGIAFIPLAEVFAIEFTVPVWTALLATVLLGERLTRVRVIAIALGIVGVLLILRPGLAVVHPAALAVLIGAVAYGVSHTLTKKLSGYDKPLTILFYMTLIQLPLGLVPSLFDWTTPSPSMWPWLIAVGLTALSAHYCMTRAFLLADATVVVPLDFLRLPLVAVLGFLFYGESIEWFVFAGAILILAGNLLNIRGERAKLDRQR